MHPRWLFGISDPSTVVLGAFALATRCLGVGGMLYAVCHQVFSNLWA